jgi:glucosamine--fructose-6-phosphate aminotransferase (isomerizing)
VFETMQRALAHIRNDFGAELIVISNNETALDLAQTPLPIPQEIPEWLTPLVGIIPAQLFAYHLTLAKGFDTERPRSIRKVTETR